MLLSCRPTNSRAFLERCISTMGAAKVLESTVSKKKTVKAWRSPLIVCPPPRPCFCSQQRARRSLSCEVFLESGKSYTASVVCLSGGHRSTATSAAGFKGFRVTVYSARPVQVRANLFPFGSIFHMKLRCIRQGQYLSGEIGRRARLTSCRFSASLQWITTIVE